MEGTPRQERAGPGSAPAESSAAIADALSRLFAAAAIYPATHVRVMTLADPVLTLLREGARDAEPLRLDVHEGGLAVGDVLLPASQAAATRLRSDLAAAGISRLEIDRTVSTEDLVALARVLRTHAQPKSGNASFRHVEITGLPATVRVSHHDFGLPSFDESETKSSAIDLVAALGLYGALDPRSVSSQASPGSNGAIAVRNVSDIASFLNSAIERASREATPRDRPAPTAVRASRGRREILRSVAESLHRAVQQAGGLCSSQTVTEVLEGARANLPQLAPEIPADRLMESLRSAIDVHLRDAFRHEAVANLSAKSQGVLRDPVGTEDVRVVMDQVKEFVAVDEPFVQEGNPSAVEHLGILLHYLATAEAGPSRDVLTERLAPLFQEPATDDQTFLLRGWFFDIVCRDDVNEVDRMLPLVLAPYAAQGTAAVAELLLSALRPPTPEALRLLWPFLVDVALRGLDSDARELEEELLADIALLDTTELLLETDRLAAMPSVRKGVHSRRVFQPPRENLYGLYELFLNTRSAPQLAVHVVDAFFRAPPNTPAAGVLCVLSPREDRARSFLGRILRENHAAGETPALRKLAAETIADAIRSCPVARRAEAWVLRAVGALRSLPGPDSEATLRWILAERRFGVVPAWPVAVRAAAREGLLPPGAPGAKSATQGPPPEVAVPPPAPDPAVAAEPVASSGHEEPPVGRVA